MNDEVKQKAIEHAHADYPREACGLVVVKKGKQVYVPCRNISERNDSFVLHPEDYDKADHSGDIISVFHSHCNTGPQPSDADRAGCESSKMPWFIVAIPGETWSTIVPCGYKAPLVGRKWVHAIHDCYTLIVDWFRETRGITLPDFERPEEWWKKGLNLYMENFEAAGFRRVTDGTLKPGDCIIMQVASDVPNHAAVYIGDGLILHHVQNRLSGREVFGGYWEKNTVAVVRHSSA